MRSHFRCAAFLITALTLAPAARSQSTREAGTHSGFVTTPDAVMIHYLEAGQIRTTGNIQFGGTPPPEAITNGQAAISNLRQQPTMLFIPGRTMPAWIWEKQIERFSKSTRVVAMDPRSQGESQQTTEGLYPEARARDIKAVIEQLHLAPVVLVGWSMGVTEVASYIDQFGNEGIAGMVLVDGSANVVEEFMKSLNSPA